jgi:four helix bundle protein
MSDIHSYRDLLVWQQAMDLAVAVYDATRHWPREELYGLTSQARRASVSVAANIAEGYGRDSFGAYISFLKVSQGSLKELETHMLLAQRLQYSTEASVSALLDQSASVGKLLRLLVRKLNESAQQS